jgi:hypothetical protein
VPTGAINGLTVIDVDPRREGDVWLRDNRHRLATRMHETRSNGQHLIFRYAPGVPNTADRIAPGIETKNDGKYVVWWPEHGCRVVGGPIAEFPGWLLAELTNNTMGVTLKQIDPAVTPMLCVPSAYQINYANRALANACFELRRCEAGRRNHLLNVLAYKMGRLIVQGWISRERVEDYLLKCCEANGLLADDGIGQCGATLASGIDAGMKRPYLRQFEDFRAVQLRAATVV